MKLGILGTGMIVKDMLTGIDELGLEQIYLLGTNETREETEELKGKYNLDKIFYDFNELLLSDVDTVYVALPNHLHFEFSKKALLHGKHVIVEKPATASLSELLILNQLANEKGLIFIEASTVNYFPVVKMVRENLKKIGNVHLVSLNFSQYSSRYDKFMQGDVLPVFDPRKAGGALMDLNVYNINLVVGLFGRPVNVHYYANIDRGIDTSGVFILEYESMKAVCIAAKDCKAPSQVIIQGDKGQIMSDQSMNKASHFTLTYNDGSIEEMNCEDKHHRLYYEFCEFIRMIDDLDYEMAKKMQDISVIVSEIIEQVRWQGKIFFENDKKIANNELENNEEY